MLLTYFVLALALQTSSGFLESLLRQEKWNGLKVTWGFNPFGNFNSMPRTATDAVKQGFKKISDCDTKASWRGARYLKDGDRSLILLFDVQGYIAGIQTAVPANQADGYPSANIQPPFIRDGNEDLLTAYFVDPATICTTGRSAAEFESQGTGNNLYIQNGTKAESDSILIPHKETGMATTQWTKGKCFYTMGVHYWYNVSENMNCDDFFPVFVLYNKGELTAFGWSMGTELTSSRLEHPGHNALGMFFDKIPKCLLSKPHLSTMHIYLTKNIALDLC